MDKKGEVVNSIVVTASLLCHIDAEREREESERGVLDILKVVSKGWFFTVSHDVNKSV